MSLRVARQLVDACCVSEQWFTRLCRHYAADEVAAACVVGALAYVIIYEDLPGGPVPTMTRLTVTRRDTGAEVDIDAVDPYTRAVARILAYLAGDDLAGASAAMRPLISDPEGAAHLIARMTTYAHQAAHRPGDGEPAIVFEQRETLS
jgi:hypothetical protein